MSFDYRDLTYIRAALQHYDQNLREAKPNECGENEYSEIQDDILYTSRLIALTNRMIEEWESKGPYSRG